MKRIIATHWGTIGLAAVLANGCSSSPPSDSKEAQPVTSEASELKGRVFYSSSCNSTVVPHIDRAMAYGRAMTQSNAFGQCIWAATGHQTHMGTGITIGPYNRCSTDPPLSILPATNVIANVRSLNDVFINCNPALNETGAGAFASLQLNAKGQEEMTLGSVLANFQQPRVACLDNPSAPNCVSELEYASIAWTIYHEAMHTHGFNHVEFGGSGQIEFFCGIPTNQSPYYGNSVPYIVQECMRATFTHTLAFCPRIKDACLAPNRYMFIEGYDSSDQPSITCTCDTPDPHPYATSYRPPSDFNQDNKTDFALWIPQTGSWKIGSNAPFNFGQVGDIPVVADYDGDGKPDIAVFRPVGGLWFRQNLVNVQWGLNGDIPVPGDYFGQKRAIPTVYRPSEHNWYIQGSSGPINFGLDGDMPVPGDFDGDGRTDIAVFRPSNGTWHIRNDNGTERATQWGLTGDIPLAIDMTGDGVDDLVVFRPSNNLWYNQSGSSAGFRWGLTGDIPVAGDFDGDMTADWAIYRPSTQTFFVKSARTSIETTFFMGNVTGIPTSGRPLGRSQ